MQPRLRSTLRGAGPSSSGSRHRAAAREVRPQAVAVAAVLDGGHEHRPVGTVDHDLAEGQDGSTDLQVEMARDMLIGRPRLDGRIGARELEPGLGQLVVQGAGAEVGLPQARERAPAGCGSGRWRWARRRAGAPAPARTAGCRARWTGRRRGPGSRETRSPGAPGPSRTGPSGRRSRRRTPGCWATPCSSTQARRTSRVRGTRSGPHRATSCVRALRSVTRLMRSCWHSSRSGGMRMPGRSDPLAISALMRSRAWIHSGSG